MPLFNWFSRKPDLEPVPALRPVQSKPGDPGARSRIERAAQRELIYPLVREAMVRVGILSTRYKFKLLSVGGKEGEFIVMMDIPPEFMSDMRQLSEIETLISKAALARHELVIVGTYWRAGPEFEAVLTPADLPRKPAPRAQPVLRNDDELDHRGQRTGFEKTAFFDQDVDDDGKPDVGGTQYGALR